MRPSLALVLFCLLAAFQTLSPNYAYGQGGPPTIPVPERLRFEPWTLDAAESDVSLQKLAELLKTQERIRVAITAGPGNGHQSAGIRLIQRLQELGFRGVTEVIYHEQTVRQLTTLIPGFDAWKTDGQMLRSTTLGNLELISQKEFQKIRNHPVVEFGFSAASDTPSNIFEYRRLHVKNFFQLQPRNWGHRGSDRGVWLENGRLVDLSHLDRMGVTHAAPQIQDLEKWLEPLNAGKNFFRAFFQRMPQLDVMPAYSIDFTEKPIRVMDMVVGGLQSAIAQTPERFQKPIVIPIFTVFRDPIEREKFDDSLKQKGVQVLQATGPAVTNRIQTLRPGEILAIHLGATPPTLFEAIVMRATLPVILEGKNLTQMSLDHGLPFLNVIGSQRDIEIELRTSRVPGDLMAKIFQAFYAFDDRQSRFGESEKKAIGRYISELRLPESPLRNFFASLRANPHSVNQDLLAQALLDFLHARRQVRTANPQRTQFSVLPTAEKLPRGVKRCHAVHSILFP